MRNIKWFFLTLYILNSGAAIYDYMTDNKFFIAWIMSAILNLTLFALFIIIETIRDNS